MRNLPERLMDASYAAIVALRLPLGKYFGVSPAVPQHAFVPDYRRRQPPDTWEPGAWSNFAQMFKGRSPSGGGVRFSHV
jgi:hypothetical protein